jgi:hypothetical protein
MPSGQDGADECGVGMTPPAKIADDSVNVKRRATLRDCQGIAIIVKEQPAGGPAVSGHPRTAGIQRANAVDQTVGDDVSVAADDDIGIASRQQRPELLIGDVRFDPWTVVGPG